MPKHQNGINQIGRSNTSLIRAAEATKLKSELLAGVALLELSSMYSGSRHVNGGIAKSVLVAIAVLTQITRPLTNDEISRVASVSNRYTRESIRALVRAGYIIEQRAGSGRGSGKWYRVSIR